jgi:hypothetical protein
VPLWGTVESTPLEGGQFCPEPAFSRLWPPIKAAAAKIGRPPSVFITFGGPQGHEDRMATWLANCATTKLTEA